LLTTNIKRSAQVVQSITRTNRKHDLCGDSRQPDCVAVPHDISCQQRVTLFPNIQSDNDLQQSRPKLRKIIDTIDILSLYWRT